MNNISNVDARVSQSEIPDIYNKLSRIYDAWGAITEGRARQRGLQLAAIQDGEAILDAAAGTGLVLFDAARRNPHGFNAGIDVSDGMLAKARLKFARLPEQNSLGKIELKQANVLDIPYPDSSFDLVLNSYMFDLMDIEEMPYVLAEFRRVLKPSGRLVLINMTLGEKPGSQIYEWIYKAAPALMGGCRGVRLAEPVQKAGFYLVRREYHQQAFFPSEVILALCQGV